MRSRETPFADYGIASLRDRKGSSIAEVYVERPAYKRKPLSALPSHRFVNNDDVSRQRRNN
jgi:hypothetical protein